MSSKGTLGERFETEQNALNAVRLGLAAVVIVWHAHLLPGRGLLPRPLQQLIEEVPVDAFFAISGLLIVRSWQQRPHVPLYLTARASRLLPGLWGCLALTAFVIVPASAMAAGSPLPTLRAQLHYLAANAGVWIGSPEIAGVSTNGPWPMWNISLWSLWWELLAYLAVALLGILGRLQVGVLVTITASLWSVGLALTLNGWWPLLSKQSWLSAFPRLGLMFCVGALLWMFRDRVPINRSIFAASVALVVVGLWTPNYRLIAAGAIGYLALSLSLFLGRWARLRLKNDLSYGVYVYGAPVQQALILVGFVGSWLTFTFATFLLVLPLAALSWWLVERPAMRWARRRARRPEQVTVPALAPTRAARDQLSLPSTLTEATTADRRPPRPQWYEEARECPPRRESELDAPGGPVCSGETSGGPRLGRANAAVLGPPRGEHDEG